MKEWRITVAPFELIDLQFMEIKQQINNHATATVVAYITEDKEDQYAEMAQKDQWLTISALAPEEDDQILFKGIIESVEIQAENALRKIIIKSISSSYLLDLKKHQQTFQDKMMTYQGALDELKKHYDSLDIYMTVGRLEPLKEFVVQYNETDWAFAKRLASHFNSFLVPDTKFGVGPKFYFGLPNRSKEEIKTISYGMRKEVGEYLNKTENDLQLREKDAIYYTLDSRDFFALGTEITLNGRALIVTEVCTQYSGAQCVHHYQLKTAEGLKTLKIANTAISGVSLTAKVIKVEKDQVKVHADIDKAQEVGKAKWFTYATVYSSPDGAGWYCMPEVGDQVRLYFPEVTEGKAFVASSVHLDGADNRNDPDIKIWKTKYGKEIRLTPGTMILTNNDGLRITLSDQDGISIESDKDITIQADGAISMDSGASVSIAGQEVVELAQNAAKLTIKKDVTFKGAKIKME